MPWYCAECGKVNPDGVPTCQSCRAPMPVKSIRISTSRLRAPNAGTPARASLADGVVVGRFQLERHIASGGFATVHLAHDVRTGERFALKVLASNLVRNQKLVERFRQEARIQYSLVHPGVVRVFELVETSETLALAMEYVDGVPLDALLEQVGRPLMLRECCEILIPVLDALDYAHRAGVVHRDLKPSNILLQRNADLPLGYWPKITDFGVAKLLDEAGVRTATGATLGTSWYMAPEQCKGEKTVDHRTDIYAVGVMLFEMVTKTVPFVGESEFAIWEGHIRHAPPRPSVLNPTVVSPLEEVILQALAKDPDDRFQSAIALRDALQNASLPPPSPAVAPAPIAWKPAPSPVVAPGTEGRTPDGVPPATRSRVTPGFRARAELIAWIAFVILAVGTCVLVLFAWLPDKNEEDSPPRDVAVREPADATPGAADPTRSDAPVTGGLREDSGVEAGPPPTPKPYWLHPSDPCSDAWCPDGWPACFDASTNQLCNSTDCGECAEALLKWQSTSPDASATAWCIGRRIAERAGLAVTTADRLRREGWGWQLIGRAFDLRNCKRRALTAYISSTEQRNAALRNGQEYTSSFQRNAADVQTWCHSLGEDVRCTVRR